MNFKSLVRMYMIITATTATLFIMLGLSGVFQQVLQPTGGGTVGKLATLVSPGLFVEALNSEMPAFVEQSTDYDNWKLVSFVFEWMTNLNPVEPRTYLLGTVPGLAKQDAVLLHASEEQSEHDAPYDPVPPSENFSLAVTPKPPKKTEKPSKQGAVFIYHSHNRESWLPELKHRQITDADLAYDPKINITLLGKRLAKLLQAKQIQAVAATDDYPSKVPEFKYTQSYAYSLETIQSAIARNGNYDFYFDLHRDSQPRDRTTLVRNGKTYAQVYFVVGGKNPNWRKNYQFARQIHDGLERRLPGLSKSIYAKSTNGNGYYNQSISPQSTLVEIGGPDNTLEECYRTVEILADVIAEMYFQAVEVEGEM